MFLLLVVFCFLNYVLSVIYLYLYLLHRFDQGGRMVSVVQYFKQQYNCSLKYPHWPCLQAGSNNRPIYLPMEVVLLWLLSFLYSISLTISKDVLENPLLSFFKVYLLYLNLTRTSIHMQVCCIVKGQRYSRKLNEDQVKQLLKLSCERPVQRESSILEVNTITNLLPGISFLLT
jgi:eukaryotic translation initiation factor 2C